MLWWRQSILSITVKAVKSKFWQIGSYDNIQPFYFPFQAISSIQLRSGVLNEFPTLKSLSSSQYMWYEICRCTTSYNAPLKSFISVILFSTIIRASYNISLNNNLDISRGSGSRLKTWKSLCKHVSLFMHYPKRSVWDLTKVSQLSGGELGLSFFGHSFK